MKTLFSVIKSIQQSGLKSVLTLITVGLVVCVLIIVLSISQNFKEKMEAELSSQGLIFYIANAEYSDSGDLERARPPEFDGQILSVLKQEVSGVNGVSPFTFMPWNEFVAQGKQYRIRSVAGVNEEYEAVTGMEIIAGSFFTGEDISRGLKKAVISDTLARILFGSAENAIGKILTSPASEREEEEDDEPTNRRRFFSPPSYEVTGVFSGYSELKRKSYGLADCVLPYTSMVPPGMNSQMAMGMLHSTLIVNVKGEKFKSTEAQVRNVLTREYGNTISLYIWEGTPGGESNTLEETRQSVNTFSLVINFLGFLLLITGSIGILSIMLVEVLGRSRDICLERALGASGLKVIKEYFIRALVMTSSSILLGIILGFIFANPIKEIVLPVFTTLKDMELTGNIITLKAVITGSCTALFIGGIFGVIPVFSVLHQNIAEGLQEV